MRLVDTHIHLNFPEFDLSRSELLRCCKSRGIAKMVIPSVRSTDWLALSDLCVSSSGLYYTAGLHPCFLEEESLVALDGLYSFLKDCSARCVGVGEIGLDARAPDIDFQVKVFQRQLFLAKEFELPVVIHSVRAHARVLECLKEVSGVRGVVHAYSGSRELAHAFVKAGLSIGVGGVICRDSAEKTRDTISGLPLESLVIETDAPDMFLPGAGKGKGSPLDLASVYEKLVSLRAESADDIQQQLWRNSHALFGLREA